MCENFAPELAEAFRNCAGLEVVDSKDSRGGANRGESCGGFGVESCGESKNNFGESVGGHSERSEESNKNRGEKSAGYFANAQYDEDLPLFSPFPPHQSPKSPEDSPPSHTSGAFEGKIIYPETSQGANFALDTSGYFLDKTAFMIKGANLAYLHAILASKTGIWYLRAICGLLGKKGINLGEQYLKRLPIPQITAQNAQIAEKITALAEAAIEKGGDAVLEREIDSLVFALYGLNADEIAVVAGEVAGK